MNLTTKKHVIVGMSGGVDSSVAALLLKQQGYIVEGLFMKNWEADDNDNFCSTAQDYTDAKSVCKKLNIPLHTINFSQEYWDKVFQNFLDEYATGRTPNPDILCNQEIKFKAFLHHALELGANYIATGHYARNQQINYQYELLKGTDENKDQSYFLYTLDQAKLDFCLFPLGKFKKSAVRKIAMTAGLDNHNKKDSTGICFIGERRFKNFLKEYLLAQPGTIETEDGKVIGQHEGLMFYTLGQRKGIGIGGQKNAKEEPWYVINKDIKRRVLVIGQGHSHPKLFSKSLQCNNVHWINGEPSFPLYCKAKIRYRQSDQSCVIIKEDEKRHHVEFDQPQRAITSGQSVVFYQEDKCLGGGIIEGSRI